MGALRLVLVGCSVGSVAALAWGSVGHFVRTPGSAVARGVLTAMTAVAAAAQITALATAPLPPWAPSALPLYAAGLALWSWSVVATRQRRPGLVFGHTPPALLLEDGPFARVRHPFYLAYTLSWIAGAVATGAWWVAAAAAPVVAAYVAAARGEELALAAGPLGPRWAAYRARTGMFLPRLGGAR